MQIVDKIPQENILFIDESGIDNFISREYAWSQQGKLVYGEKPGRKFARESFIAGLKNKQIIAPFCYQGTMNTKLFNFWLVNFLLPSASVGDVIVMDNAAFHKSEEIECLINEAGCKLLFLPPYSPDLNPIEKCWANLKDKIKKTIDDFTSLSEAIDNAFKEDHLIFN